MTATPSSPNPRFLDLRGIASGADNLKTYAVAEAAYAAAASGRAETPPG